MSNYLNLDRDNELLNKAKELTVYRLISEGYLTEEEGEEFLQRSVFLTYNKNWIKRWVGPNKDESQLDDKLFFKIFDTSVHPIVKEDRNEVQERKARYKVLEHAFKNKEEEQE